MNINARPKQLPIGMNSKRMSRNGGLPFLCLFFNFYYNLKKPAQKTDEFDDLFDDEQKFDNLELFDLRESHRDQNEDEPIWRVYEKKSKAQEVRILKF